MSNDVLYLFGWLNLHRIFFTYFLSPPHKVVRMQGNILWVKFQLSKLKRTQTNNIWTSEPLNYMYTAIITRISWKLEETYSHMIQTLGSSHSQLVIDSMARNNSYQLVPKSGSPTQIVPSLYFGWKNNEKSKFLLRKWTFFTVKW